RRLADVRECGVHASAPLVHHSTLVGVYGRHTVLPRSAAQQRGSALRAVRRSPRQARRAQIALLNPDGPETQEQRTERCPRITEALDRVLELDVIHETSGAARMGDAPFLGPEELPVEARQHALHRSLSAARREQSLERLGEPVAPVGLRAATVAGLRSHCGGHHVDSLTLAEEKKGGSLSRDEAV